jgi:hypothetical protein
LGDSHARGIAIELQLNLGHEFEVHLNMMLQEESHPKIKSFLI